MEDLGIGPALRAYAKKSAASDTEVRADCDTTGADFSAKELTAPHRVLREAFSNVMLHSRGQRVEVRAWGEGPSLRAVVVDDGRGFDLRARRTKGG